MSDKNSNAADNLYSQEELQKQAAKYCLKFIGDNEVIGLGTGQEINFFIEELAKTKLKVKGFVPSSKLTESELRKHHLPILEFNKIENLPIYIGTAHEALKYGQLIKGTGDALSQEKKLAYSAKDFICVIDESKLSTKLGKHPVPIEVVPSARSTASTEISGLGGHPVYRKDFNNDNQNIILDVEGLDFSHPKELEEELDHIPGVVCNGIFAKKLASKIIVATQAGIKELPEEGDYCHLPTENKS